MNAPVHEGEILANKYRVERVLGEGGMGVVVAAVHLQLEQKVALKFLLPHAMANGEAVARFLREARAAVKLKGEHVAKVSDVGTLENGAPYMVMEYLEGMDLADLLAQRGRLTVEESIDFLCQAGEALAEAHNAGIVHRDLKPANLFIARRHDGTPLLKILDFGISKMDGGLDGGMTKTTAVMGSPYYMSPEQMRSSRNVDARSDLWALGIIFYELLTGSVAFDADTMPELCANVLTCPTPDIRSVAPDTPREVEAIINRCLEKDPKRRYQSVGELARDLAPLAPDRARTNIERILRMQGGGVATILSSSSMTERTVATQQSRVLSVSGQRTDVNWGDATALQTPRSSPKTARIALAAVGLGALVSVTFFLSRGSIEPPKLAAQPEVQSPVSSTSASVADSVSHVAPKETAAKETLPTPSSSGATDVAASVPSAAKGSGGKGGASSPTASPTHQGPKTPASNADPFGTTRH